MFTTKIDVYIRTLTGYNAPAVSKSCLFSCHVSLTTESYLRLCQPRRSRRLHRLTNEKTSPKLLIICHYGASKLPRWRARDAHARTTPTRISMATTRADCYFNPLAAEFCEIEHSCFSCSSSPCSRAPLTFGPLVLCSEGSDMSEEG